MKIYISSTFEDLKDYRASVYHQLRKLRHDVISMEDYTAGDERPLDKCLQDVQDSDVYVGIFAWRYGYIPVKNNPGKRSITELEYRHAVRCKKQCLIFILDKNAQWSPQFMDVHSGKKDAGKSINKLRLELTGRHSISWFTTSDKLVSDVLTSVYRVQFDALSRPAPELKENTPKAKGQPLVLDEEKKSYSREGYNKLWKPGTTLHVSFLDGSARQQSFVSRFAPIWSAYANIKFEFGNNPAAELRVSFKEDGSWSYLGTDALTVNAKMPTLNFGWLIDSTEDTQADYVILREFGHVLGLQNEHRNPLETIPWNKEAVYKTFGGAPNFWPRKIINDNFFSHWEKNSFPIKKSFDPQSIMAFPIEAELTNGKFKIGWNTQLSTGDKEFVTQLYSFDLKKIADKPAIKKTDQ